MNITTNVNNFHFFHFSSYGSIWHVFFHVAFILWYALNISITINIIKVKKNMKQKILAIPRYASFSLCHQLDDEIWKKNFLEFSTKNEWMIVINGRRKKHCGLILFSFVLFGWQNLDRFFFLHSISCRKYPPRKARYHIQKQMIQNGRRRLMIGLI